MKKTMIIALLIVLVISVFTACNGDVNADMADKKTITLEIPSGWVWVFGDNETKTKEVEIPSGCETWQQFLETEPSISIKHGDIVLTLKVYGNGKIYFGDEDGYPWFGLDFDESKSSYPDAKTTTATEKIVVGGTYVLTSGGPT